MGRRLLAVAVLLAVAAAVAGLWWARFRGRTSLGYRMEQAASPEARVVAVRDLLASQDPQAESMVRRHAQRNPLAAYDAIHRLFVLHDPATGLMHAVEGAPGPAGAGPPAANAAGRVFSQPIGSPPQRFVEVAAVGVGTDELWFVFRPPDEPQGAPAGTWYGWQFRWKAGAVEGATVRALTEAIRERLRESPAWPRAWH